MFHYSSYLKFCAQYQFFIVSCFIIRVEKGSGGSRAKLQGAFKKLPNPCPIPAGGKTFWKPVCIGTSARGHTTHRDSIPRSPEILIPSRPPVRSSLSHRRRHHRQWPLQAPRRRHDLRVAAGFAPLPRLPVPGLPSLAPIVVVPLFVDWYFP